VREALTRVPLRSWMATRVSGRSGQPEPSCEVQPSGTGCVEMDARLFRTITEDHAAALAHAGFQRLALA